MDDLHPNLEEVYNELKSNSYDIDDMLKLLLNEVLHSRTQIHQLRTRLNHIGQGFVNTLCNVDGEDLNEDTI